MNRKEFLTTTTKALLALTTPQLLTNTLEDKLTTGFKATYHLQAKQNGALGRIHRLLNKEFTTTAYCTLTHNQETYQLTLQADDIRREITVHGNTHQKNKQLHLQPTKLQVNRLGKKRFEVHIQPTQATYQEPNNQPQHLQTTKELYEPITGLLMSHSYNQELHLINHKEQQLTKSKLHTTKQPNNQTTIHIQDNTFWSFTNHLQTQGTPHTYQGIKIPQTIHLNKYRHTTGFTLTNIQATLQEYHTTKQ